MKLYAILSAAAFAVGVAVGPMASPLDVEARVLAWTLGAVLHTGPVWAASAVYALYRPDPVTGDWEA